MATAYDRVVALKRVQDQEKQRAMSPLKVGQKIFGEWARSHGTAVDVCMAADLVKRIEAAIIAERVIGQSTNKEG